MMIPIDQIVMGERRRQDYGDLDDLAASIQRYGLLHPIIITDDFTLVAGGRRLLACRALGWAEIECKRLGELTEAERREIELEENLRRKDLTAYERSRSLVTLAETAAEVDRETYVSNRNETAEGRPEEPGSLRRAAHRIGAAPSEISKARAHVAAVEAHPHLADEPQSTAIDYARTVEAEPDLADADLPVSEVVDIGRQRRKARKLATERASSDLMVIADSLGLREDHERRLAHQRVMDGFRNAAVLASIPADWAAEHFEPSDRESIEVGALISSLRLWLDRFAAMRAGESRSLRIVE